MSGIHTADSALRRYRGYWINLDTFEVLDLSGKVVAKCDSIEQARARARLR